MNTPQTQNDSPPQPQAQPPQSATGAATAIVAAQDSETAAAAKPERKGTSHANQDDGRLMYPIYDPGAVVSDELYALIGGAPPVTFVKPTFTTKHNKKTKPESW